MNGKTDELGGTRAAWEQGSEAAASPPTLRLAGFGAALRQKWVLAAGVGGVVLLALLGAFGAGGDSPRQEQPDTATVAMQPSVYEQQLEERLERLISQVEGAGEVTVMVVLEGGEQAVYAQARQESTDTVTDALNGGSIRSSYTSDYVLIDDGGGSYALTETTLLPAVKGVAVVCTGAGDTRVVNRIVMLISTVLGITTNRICVTN